MTWIKRNLFFLIGVVVALGLTGGGGWYFYSEYRQEAQSANDILQQYSKLRTLTTQTPSPGKQGGEVDNVAKAKEQKKQADALIEKLRAGFQTPKQLPINQDFQSELDGAVKEMTAAAREQGVTLPTDYRFTFQSENRMVNLPANTFPELAAHQARIRAICDVLFKARINTLDTLERPLIPEIETNNGTDFLATPAAPAKTAATAASAAAAATAPPANSAVVMTPYKVSFHCFSGELGNVLAGLASSPYGLIVKYVDVDPGSAARSDVKPKLPGRNERPAKYLQENILGVTLLIEVVEPKSLKPRS